MVDINNIFFIIAESIHIKYSQLKIVYEPGMVTHVLNPSNDENLHEFQICINSCYWVSFKPLYHVFFFIYWAWNLGTHAR